LRRIVAMALAPVLTLLPQEPSFRMKLLPSVHFPEPCKSRTNIRSPGAGGTHRESVALDAANESSGRSLPIDAGLLSDQHHVAIDGPVAGGVPLMIPKVPALRIVFR